MTIQPPTDDHFHRIYSGNQTHLYDAMILCEDVQQNLLATLAPYLPVGGKLLDVGAGTGRIGRLLNPQAGQILSVDLNLPMLKIARQHQEQHAQQWMLSAGDATQLPVRTKWADIAIEGWALGQLVGWFPGKWKPLIDRALAEMARTTQGALILIETMGTGFEQPAPPAEHLAHLYEYWETQHGFQRTVIRTDYVFPDVETAVRLVDFFFGKALANRLLEENTTHLIEWTGVWVHPN